MARDPDGVNGEGRRERRLTASIVRLGRLIELLSAGGGDREAFERFRRQLLQSFIAVANDAASPSEVDARLSLFEEALAGAAANRGKVPAAAAGATRGFVSLVGAGPGDPGLLTLKGAQRLREADVVYYDALAPAEILGCCRPEARLVPVGKRRGGPSARQDDIEGALVRDARAGLSVVRLKGGDPFVFGRGGEEALTLIANGVPFEVVPGVTSGTAVPAIAGIPITHRGLARSTAFVTAHDLGSEDEARGARERLVQLARGADTIVVFMAGARVQSVREALLASGLAPDTPAAIIENGTTSEERTAVGTLGDLVALHERLGSDGGPTLLIVGPTVALAHQLRTRSGAESAQRLAQTAGTWFEVGKLLARAGETAQRRTPPGRLRRAK